MKITLEPTRTIETVNGMPARLWKGTSDKGAAILCWVAIVQVDLRHSSQDQLEDFEKELREVKPDRQLVSFDMRMVL
jgi:hypothetical protein